MCPCITSLCSAISQMLASGVINPVVARAYPLEEAPKAHDDIINGGTGASGKLVLTVREEPSQEKDSATDEL